MADAILAIYEAPADATQTVDDLVGSGITRERISVLASESTAKDSLVVKKQTKGAEGTAIGGGIGAAAGAVLAGLTSVGVIATSGVGLLVAGPLVAVLTGAGAGGIAGGVIGGLTGLGFSEHEIKHVEDALNEGSVVVAVEVDGHDDEDKIKDILHRHSAKEVSTA
ncbi:MAG: DUF1269 domain-containing protein [Planctomycetota bacterium]